MADDDGEYPMDFRCRIDGKLATIFGSYTGHGEDDFSGYYYRHDGETKEHWIIAGSPRITRAHDEPCERCNTLKRAVGADHRCGDCGELI